MGVVENYNKEKIVESIPINNILQHENKIITYEDIWEYILNNNQENKEAYINEQILFYMNMHLKDVDKFEQYLNDSYYFIYYVINELEKEKLPLELALIPYIESNYDPFSISSSGAVGMWQFMPKTGRLYELNKTWWNEDRHDPYRSTEAAVDYLKYLYERFNQDVYLTLAAYNGGEGTLSKAIEKNKDASKAIKFWDLQLPNETENYVPKFLALAHIIKNKDSLKIDLPSIPNQKVFEIIEIRDQIEISTIVEVSDLDYETFTKFNPGFRRSVTPPNKKFFHFFSSRS